MKTHSVSCERVLVAKRAFAFGTFVAFILKAGIKVDSK